jgi:exodeoxyribonuclease V gamma subunit
MGLELRKNLGGLDLPRHLGEWGGSPGLKAGLEALLDDCGPLADRIPPLPDRSRITLRELRRWLECPVQGGVALRLGVKDTEGEDPAEVDEEPLDTDSLETWGLLRRSLWSSVATGQDPATRYEALREESESAAKAPLGALGEGERARHQRLLKRWAGLLERTEGVLLHRFGAGAPFETRGLPLEDHPPISLAVPHREGGLELRLEGLTEPLRGADFLLLSKSEYTEKAPASRDKREALRAWLGHLALCASGSVRDRRALLHCAPEKKADAVWALPLPAVGQGEARDRLQAWGREIFVEAGQELQPIEAVLADLQTDLQDWIRDQQDGEDIKGLTSFRGPVPWAKDLPAGDLEAARDRLKAFLELQGAWEKA